METINPEPIDRFDQEFDTDNRTIELQQPKMNKTGKGENQNVKKCGRPY